MPSTVETVTSRAGHPQLRRRWAVAEPRAAMLLVHGIAEHSGRYEHVGDHFAAHGIDTLSFDLRGHGESGGRRGHVQTFDDFLDDVEELIGERRELGVPVILMGHSLGGLIVSTYIVRGRTEPDLLVLSAPALAADVPRSLRMVAAGLGRVAPTLSIRNQLKGEVLSRDEAVGNTYRDDPLRLKGATARLIIEMFTAMRTTTEQVARITLPTYVLHGTGDRLVPASASAPLDGMANVTRTLHADLRHECLNEPERDDVLRQLTAWLDEKLTTIPSPTNLS